MTDETEPNPVNPTPRPHSRWLKIVLIVSVSLNLLVAGAMGAHLLRNQYGGGWSGANFRGGEWHRGRELIRALPRQRRKLIIDEFRARRGEFRKQQHAVGEARRRVGQALRNGMVVDYLLAFDELALAESATLRSSRKVMAEVAGRLTKQERETFAKYLERTPRGRRPQNGKDQHR